MTSFHKYLDYAHCMCFPTHRVMYLGQTALDLKEKQGELERNTKKPKYSTWHCTLPIYINGLSIEGIDQLAYLGCVVLAHGGIKLGVTWHINSPRFTFVILSNVWKYNYLYINTKLRLFFVNVLSYTGEAHAKRNPLSLKSSKPSSTPV